MINKYTELHEKLLDLMGRYHNLHIKFVNKPSIWSSKDLVSIMMEMGRLVRDIKKNNLVMRKGMKEEVIVKKKSIAIKKEAKKLRKQKNDNRSQNTL